ncbi:MAG: filamentous hemagglutinin N-terminal domain-containing protein, partial [Betaproteobacteria bacterium]|nr:filamentous hemagglutinin N-terminal domain-containing protein [Betaproteobacteria bacterium]
MRLGLTAVTPLRQRRLIAVAVASALAGAVQANPTIPTVTHGSATFQSAGKTLSITNSPNAIIRWQGFSIGADEVTRFIQQSAASSVLNRVTGAESSAILGQLLSNGRVYLINPNGIFIGGGAVIDVAGFLASSLSHSDSDFLAGKFRFNEQVGAGRVVNQGTIKTQTGGMVYLIAPNVENNGVITSPTGEVILAAGKTVELVQAGSPYVSVELTAPENEAINVGRIVADAGRVGIYGTTIRNGGELSANSASVDAQGRVVLRAKKDVTLEAGSTISASGPNGGEVTVQAEGGTLLASGAVEAKGSVEKGGTVRLLGERVGLIGEASVDASGDRGGGTVLVGGDFQGKNVEVQNAKRTFVGAGASLKADAITEGNGGKVIVWADDSTKFYGTVTARGGERGGNGGFVEISGKQTLSFIGSVDTTAPNGKTGTLLLDPTTLQITNGGPVDGDLSTNASDGTVVFGDADGTSNGVAETTLEGLASTTGVVLEATGQITVNNLADNLLDMKQSGGAANFRMTSTGSGGINFLDAADEISTAGGSITLQAQGTGSLSNIGKLTSKGGAVLLESASSIGLAGNITTSGGLVTLNASTLVDLAATKTITTTAAADSGTISGAIDINVSGTGTVNLAGDLVTTGATHGTATGSAGGAVTIDTANGAIAVANITTSGGAATGGANNGGGAGTIGINTGTDNVITLNASTLTAAGGAGFGGGTQGAGATISFGDPVSLAAGGVTIDTGATAGNISFAQTLNGGQTLGLTAGTGDIVFTGIVGGGTPLGAVTINAANNVLAASTIAAASLVQSAGTGTTTLTDNVTTTAA